MKLLLYGEVQPWLFYLHLKYTLVGAFSLFLFPNFSKEWKGALFIFLLPALGVG
jgi:hypothetical protein